MIKNITFDEFRLKVLDIKNEKFKVLSDKPVFLTFYAEWWGPCRMLKQVLEEIIPEYKDRVDFYKVESEKELVLSSFFKVMSLPNSATISLTGEINSHVGVISKETLKYYLDGLILKSNKGNNDNN